MTQPAFSLRPLNTVRFPVYMHLSRLRVYDTLSRPLLPQFSPFSLPYVCKYVNGRLQDLTEGMMLNR